MKIARQYESTFQELKQAMGKGNDRDIYMQDEMIKEIEMISFHIKENNVDNFKCSAP